MGEIDDKEDRLRILQEVKDQDEAAMELKSRRVLEIDCLTTKMSEERLEVAIKRRELSDLRARIEIVDRWMHEMRMEAMVGL